MERSVHLSDIDHLRHANYKEMRKRLETEKLTDAEVDKLYDIVEVTAELFDEYNIRYTIEGGTLLGAVRNGGLIKHDNDADFDVLQDDLLKIKALNSKFGEYGLEVIDVPGWGQQISHINSPSLAPGLWTDGINRWTSKWPFLDLIAIRWDEITGKYILAQDVAHHDYPDYFLTKSEWEDPFEKIQFGHLKLSVIGGCKNRRAYLDRHYKNWDKMIEMNMNHRTNEYFESKIICPFRPEDFGYRSRSNNPTTLTKQSRGLNHQQ